MFTIGEVVKVRTPVSNLWFNAFLIAKEGDKFIVETFFPVQAMTRWTVNSDNIQKMKEVMEINFFGTANCVKAVEKNFKEKKGGHISIVSSVAG